MSVASGQADVGLGLRSAASVLDLSFVPIIWEEFDIVLGEDTLAAGEPLMGALRDPDVLSSIRTPSGYDLSRTGSIEMLT